MGTELGKRYEDMAAEFLAAKGFSIIARNFRARGGEIDLICLDKTYVAFVEVRGRSSAAFGAPRETIGAAKRRRIKTTALTFIAQNKICNKDFRFDVVEILGGEIEYIENAFW